MGTFYVTRNLKHDGKEYRRGDEIVLNDASSLLAAGVVQNEPVQDAAPAPAPVEAPVEPETASVGGNELHTGEPSVDGADTSSGTRAEATDISPVVDAPEAEKAPEEKPGFMSKIFGSKPEGTQQAPVNDPSKDL